jgi:uncharacterized protein (TIGR02594 family)
MIYPNKYEWLGRVGLLPLLVQKGLQEYGTLEAPGAANNKKILGWASELGIRATYTADSVPWCGLFMGVVAKRAGKSWPKNPLWALNWAKWGVEAGQPMLGDILTFTRDGGGHVGVYIAEDTTTYHVLGGNQNNSVSITRILKKRLYRARRPRWLIRKPPSVKPYIVNINGVPISTNER